MGEKRQAVTYFTFKGGLNTKDSDLNASPETARELLNIEMTEAGTVKRRPSFNFLPPNPTSTVPDYAQYKVAYSTTFPSEGGVVQKPAPSGIEFTVSPTTSESFSVMVIVVGGLIYIYNTSDIAGLSAMGSYRQAFPLNGAWLTGGLAQSRGNADKVCFAQQGNRLFITAPYFPLVFLYYDETADTFKIESEQIYDRNIETALNADARVTQGGNVYRCIKRHSSLIAAYTPGTGIGWRDVWVLEGPAPATGAPAAWTSTGHGHEVTIQAQATTTTTGTGTQSSFTVYEDYECLQTHTSSAGTSPTIAPTYWKLIRRRITSTTTTADAWGSLRGPINPMWSSASVSYVVFDPASTSFPYNTNVFEVNSLTDTSIGAVPTGFNWVAAAGGRLWIASPRGDRTSVFFSQSVNEPRYAKLMYQEADPLNADDPDVVDSDGGKIRIVGAGEIYNVYDYKAGVLIGCLDGIWTISGADGFFKPTLYSIQKMSSDGMASRFSAEYVEDTIIYAGLSGIYAASQSQADLTSTSKELSIQIRDFWLSLPKTQRQRCELSYNTKERQLRIGMNFTEEEWSATANTYNNATHYRDFLILNLYTGAWYKQSLQADTTGNSIAIGGMFTAAPNTASTVAVTDSTVTVTDSAVAVTDTPSGFDSAEETVFIYNAPDAAAAAGWYLGTPQGEGFTDFADVSIFAETSAATIRTVPQHFGDIGHQKQAPYIFTAFDIVETGFDGVTQLYTNPGGCTMRLLWDFVNGSTASPKYGKAVNAYRPNFHNKIFPDGSLYPRSSVINKHRMRGRGRTVAVQFESDGDKDFHLLGWQTTLYVDPEV